MAYVTHFQGKTELTSHDFLKIFKQFDKDGNGFIEAGELDEFLTALWKEGNKKEVPDSNTIANMKEEILKKYDDNFDGKIDLEELAKILPTEQNFLAQFQNSTELTSVDFFKVWNHYDVDHSGYIDSDELKGFLTDLLGREGQALTPQRIDDYCTAMLDLFDQNKDGKLSLSEMSKILPVEDNFLRKFKKENGFTDEQFNQIWSKYDKDGNGFIVDEELEALIYDLVQKDGGELDDPEELKTYKDWIMKIHDTNKDGKIGKDELKLLLVSQ